MKSIPLSRGLVAVVDDADFEELSRFKWSATSFRTSGPYAVRKDGSRMVLMHRELLCAGLVDHIDGNGLNNQRANLRPASVGENAHNQRMRSTNTSGVKGVSFDKARGKWIGFVGRKEGGFRRRFDTFEEAHAAVLNARSELHGEFRRDK